MQLDQISLDVITSLDELASELKLSPQLLHFSDQSQELLFSQFPLCVPRSFVRRMHKGNINDPLLLQVLPRTVELQQVAGYTIDPLEEQKYSPMRGVLHKYHGRVLLLLNSNCCINCRFCFRRHLRSQVEDLGKVLQYIEGEQSIEEVILSGGEPLLWDDNKLVWLLLELAKIPHLQRVRIHSRMPILIPERITEHFAQMLVATRLKAVLVVHCNHVQEISEEVKIAMNKLRLAGVTLLNQSVLLKNINDNVAALVDLSEALFSAGIMPYYLHLLDKVAGSAHFYVEPEEARKLIGQVAQKISGYLVPKLVCEQSGAPAKVNL